MPVDAGGFRWIPVDSGGSLWEPPLEQVFYFPTQQASMSTRNREENITLIPGNDGSYKCSFPDCNASYRRKEHLQRHRVKHSQPEPFQCPNCPREFGRR